MNRSESKYFNTARLMDKAFIELLAKKDIEYITVKEICQKAGVNRSTFYLHYETIGDLLAESVENLNRDFFERMNGHESGFVKRLRDCPIDELYLITPEYLTPYLEYVKENRRIMRTMLENADVLKLDRTYERMFRHVFTPILERFGVPDDEMGYLMSFYINGLTAMIVAWLKNDCKESIDRMIGMIRRCAEGRAASPRYLP